MKKRFICSIFSIIMVLACGILFVGCGLQNADDNKQNSVSSTDNTNNPTGEAVSRAGIDMGTGADAPTGVDTATAKNADKELVNAEETTAPSNAGATNAPDRLGKTDDPSKVKNIKLEVERWDSQDKDFSITMERYGSGRAGISNDGEKAELLAFGENYKTVLSKNTDHVVGPVVYRDERDKLHKATQYFVNDNSYVIYEAKSGKKHNYLYAVNQMVKISSPDDEDGYYKFPFPSSRYIDEYYVEQSWNKDEDFISKTLFKHFSLKELKKFYSTFSKGIVVYNKENKTFKIKGKYSSSEDGKLISNENIYVTLDMKHKTIKVENERGIEKLSSKIFNDRLWAQFKRIGTIGGKTFYYTNYGEVMVVKNGKRKLVIDDEKESTIYEHTGWNCVGDSIDMKFAKECTNDNIVMDVVLHMEEDGKWKVKGKIYFDRNGEYKKVKI